MGRGELVDDILTECFIRLGQHIGELTVSGEAARFWRARYRERFAATLAQEHPRAWSEDRLNVLAKAASLGRLAAEFAAADETLVIGEGHARRASEANDCRPRSRYGMFSIWCLPPNKRQEKAPATEVDGWWARQAQRVFAR